MRPETVRMALDPRIIELVIRYEELREQGRPATPEDLCRDCPELLDELRKNLLGLQEVDQLVQAPDAADYRTVSLVPRPDGPGGDHLPRVEGYEVLEELGAGGMGVVYKARQLRLNRVVALKMILTGAHASRAERERFRREAEVVAQLRHPHIVQIYELGEQDGIPYLALEYVAGGSLAKAMASGDWAVGSKGNRRAAAQLVETLARAVHSAHQQGIIHRDLKPANVLLATEETQGHQEKPPAGSSCPFVSYGEDFCPKIADFGLAKQLNGTAAHTRTGDLLGTPSYMAPEQAAGRSKDVGPAADVYALGAILYELLTGRPPFRGEGHYETVRQVLEVEPVPPSRLRQGVPRDLEIVCLKCLEKQAARRYASALELAEDLRRFLTGEPIRARRAGPWERAVRWVQRRPAAALAALAAVSLLALAGAVWYTTQLRDALGQLREAQAEISLSQRQHQYARDVRAAFRFWRNGDLREMRRLLERQHSAGTALLGFEWGYLWRLFQDSQANVLPGHQGAVHAAAFSPSGRHAVTGGQDGVVRLWDTADWHEVGAWHGHTGGVLWAGFHDDKTLLTVGEDRTARLWSVPEGIQRPPWAAFHAAPSLVALTPDRRLLALAFPDRRVLVLTLPEGKRVGEFASTDDTLKGLAFTADGQHLVTVSNRGVLIVFAPNGMRVAEILAENSGGGLAFTHSGRLLANTSRDGRIVLRPFSPGTPPVLGSQRALAGRVYRRPLHFPAFSSDDRLLAVAAEDDSLRLEDLASSRPGIALRGHADRLTGLTFAPNGTTLLSTSLDGTARHWDVADRQEWHVPHADLDAAGPLALAPDGRLLAVADRDRAIRIVDMATRQVRTILRGHLAEVRDLVFSPDGRALAVAADRTVRVWSIPDGRLLVACDGHTENVEAVAFGSSGQRLASGGRDGTLRVWNLETGKAQRVLAAPGPVVCSVSFSANDALLAAACAEHTGVRVWEVATGKELHNLGHDTPATTVRFTHGGATLAVAQVGTNRVTLWDAPTARLLRSTQAGGNLPFLAFSADDRYCFAADGTFIRWFATDTGLWQKEVSFYDGISHVAARADGTALAVRTGAGAVHLLTPADWSLRSVAVQRPFSVSSLAVSADGKILATGSTFPGVKARVEFFTRIDRSVIHEAAEDVRLFDMATGRSLPRWTPELTVTGLPLVAFSPDGRSLAAGTGEGSVWVWDRANGAVRQRFRVARRATLLGAMADEIVQRNPRWLGGNIGPNWQAGRIRALAFAPDSRLLAAASDDGVVKVLDIVGGCEVAVLPEAPGTAACLAFAPDGRRLAVGRRHEVTLWDVTSRQPVRTLRGHRDPVWSLAFRPDGGVLATGGQDARIRLWDPESGDEVGTLVGHEDTVAGLAFSPHDGGRSLASGGHDGKVKVWHLATGVELLNLEAHAGRVNAVAFTPDGSVLATGGETVSGAGEVFFWRAAGP